MPEAEKVVSIALLLRDGDSRSLGLGTFSVSVAGTALARRPHTPGLSYARSGGPADGGQAQAAGPRFVHFRGSDRQRRIPAFAGYGPDGAMDGFLTPAIRISIFSTRAASCS